MQKYSKSNESGWIFTNNSIGFILVSKNHYSDVVVSCKSWM